MYPILILGLMLPAGCGNDNSTSPQPIFSASEPFQFTVTKGARTKLELRGVSGSINVTGVAGASAISVAGVKQVDSFTPSDARIQLDVLQVEIDSSGTELLVQTDQPTDSQGRNYTVNYTVTVPEDFQVALVNVNGPVSAEAIRDSLVVLATNGEIDVTGTEGSTSLTLINGPVDASVTIPPGGGIVMATTNGDLTLQIPQSTSAQFSSSFANGSINVTGLILTDIDQTPTSLSGTLGTGNGTIVLTVANGTISVMGI
jgi:hypothetical protein